MPDDIVSIPIHAGHRFAHDPYANHTVGALMIRSLSIAVLALLLAGCQSAPTIPTVQKVNLQRFMGDWYVIAHLPTFVEKGAYNAKESYKLREDGTIATTFTFNKNALDGPLKTQTPTGFVYNTGSNAEWRMQFIWPFKAEYLIAYLDESYQYTIIARNKRDYVWIMARQPHIPEAQYEALAQRVRDMNYDVTLLRRVPHGKQ